MRKDQRYIKLIVNLGIVLRTMREAQLYSTQEAAEGCEIPFDSYLQYETGTQEISLEDLYKVANFFDIKLQSLFNLVSQLEENELHNIPSLYDSEDSEASEFIQNFLKVNGSNRGMQFKDFVYQMHKKIEE